MAAYHLLLIEDDVSVAKGLIAGLEQDGFTVTWADTGEGGLGCLRGGVPHSGTPHAGAATTGAAAGRPAPDVHIDLVILDLRLPDMTGFDVARQIRGDGNSVPILILTASDDEVDTVLGFELGADEYVTKPFRLRPLISRIRAMLRRTYGELAGGASQTLRFGEVVVDRERLRVTKRGDEVFLTPTELRILLYLLDRPERPVTREMIVAGVWGDDYILEDPRTVDVHIRH
ncbi:MAG: response regulator, partial [Spirochaetes bacterium]|nr:response regulator [Spirochaetota bacterium]